MHTTVHAAPEGGTLLEDGVELKWPLRSHSRLSSKGKSDKLKESKKMQNCNGAEKLANLYRGRAWAEDLELL